MRHIIAILLQNEAGALTRVAGLFSSRGYNIESLSVAPTDDPALSRLTLLPSGEGAVPPRSASRLRGPKWWTRPAAGQRLLHRRAARQRSRDQRPDRPAGESG